MGESGPLNGIPGLEKIDKTQLPNQEKSVEQIAGVANVKKTLDDVDETNPLGLVESIKDESDSLVVQEEPKKDKFENVIKIQVKEKSTENSQEAIEKPQSVIEKPSIKLENAEEEKGPERELAEKWVKKFLPFEVLDAYALSYENSKKPDERKRKNEKYKKAFKKANESHIPYLIGRFDSLFASKSLNNNSSEDEIKAKILEIIHSGLHAKNLETAIKQYEYNNQEKVDKAIINLNTNRAKVAIAGKSSVKREIPITEAEIFGGDSVNHGDSKEKLTQKVEEKIQETPKTKEEFFEKYKKGILYVNYVTGEELEILDYVSQENKVKVSVHSSYFYNKENESYEFLKKNNRRKEQEMTLEEFKKFAEKSFTDEEMEEDAKKQSEKEEKEQRKDFWKEFSKYKNIDGFKILFFGYISQKKEYLAKIREKGQKPKFVNKQDLRALIKKLSSQKLEKKIENSDNKMEELTEIEQKVVGIFERYIEDYRQAVKEQIRENKIIKKDTRNKIENDYVEYFIENELAEKIALKLRLNGISNVSREKVLKELKMKTKLI